jgi:hypothetical protein
MAIAEAVQRPTMKPRLPVGARPPKLNSEIAVIRIDLGKNSFRLVGPGYNSICKRCIGCVSDW